VSGEELELLWELFALHSTWREQPLSQRREYYERADAAFGGPGVARGELVAVGECSAEWVLPLQPGSPVLLYFHGGSYTMGSAASHRHLVRELGEVCGGSALAVDYRRAPEAPFPAAVSDAVACYRYLLERGVPSQQIIFAGDSAGGGILVAAMLALREAGLAQPATGDLRACPDDPG
jgi:phosphinothricin tripeptide acetyl hydrolase